MSYQNRYCPVTHADCREGLRCGNFKGCIIENLGDLYYVQKKRERIIGRWAVALIAAVISSAIFAVFA